MAEGMIQQALGLMEGESLLAERTVKLKSSGTIVSCRADHIQRTAGGISVRRLKAGRLAKKEDDEKPRYLLVQAAIRTDHPNEAITFEHISLLTGEKRSATIKKQKGGDDFAKFENAIAAAGTGQFDPTANPRCPTCPYFFICPSHGEQR
jgi:hypothetical protein